MTDLLGFVLSQARQSLPRVAQSGDWLEFELCWLPPPSIFWRQVGESPKLGRTCTLRTPLTGAYVIERNPLLGAAACQPLEVAVVTRHHVRLVNISG